jgi:hypothetical protein
VGCAFATRLKEWISRLKLSSQKGGEIYQVGISWEKRKKKQEDRGGRKFFL